VEVTDILRDRMAEPAGLQQMVAVSLLVHGAALALFVVAPGNWLSSPPAEPKTVMTITLGGGNTGPTNGGTNPIGGRAIQTEAAPDPKRPEPVRPPAAATPEMTVPAPAKTPARAAAAAAVKQAPDEARGRTPTRGAEIREGSAVAETGTRGQGFGLPTSGGAGSGSKLDVENFCCPEYLVLMVEKIRTTWNPQAEVAGETMIKFTIQRDGTITNPELEKSSGYTALNINALRAVVGARQLPPLPPAFPNPTLTVHLNFQYTR
jgi:periplasmic protein TonB